MGFPAAGPPQFYGSVKVGERGQVVIPQAARVQMGIRAGDKLLAIGGIPGGQGLVLVKAEAFSTLIEELTAKMRDVARLLEATELDAGAPRARKPATKTKRSRS
jgi:AbrB family looped-hinge helix DNA binding protein